MLVFGQPAIDESAIDAVAAVLRSGWLGRGPQVQEFEDAFARYVGARHACALNSCWSGLFLALHLLGIGSGDEVITTPMTFPATLNAIVNLGAMPVLVDVNRDDQNLDPEAV